MTDGTFNAIPDPPKFGIPFTSAGISFYQDTLYAVGDPDATGHAANPSLYVVDYGHESPVRFFASGAYSTSFLADPYITSGVIVSQASHHNTDFSTGDGELLGVTRLTASSSHATDFFAAGIVRVGSNVEEIGFPINLSEIFNNARGYEVINDTNEDSDEVLTEIVGHYLYIVPVAGRLQKAEITVRALTLTDSSEAKIIVDVEDGVEQPDSPAAKSEADIFPVDIPDSIGTDQISLIPLYDYVKNAKHVNVSMSRGFNRNERLSEHLNDIVLTRLDPLVGEAVMTIEAVSLSDDSYTRTITITRQDQTSDIPAQKVAAGETVTVDTSDYFSHTDRLCVYADPHYANCHVNTDNDIVLRGIRPTDSLPVYVEYFAPDPYDVFPVGFSNKATFKLTVTGESMLPEVAPTLKSEVKNASVEGTPGSGWNNNKVSFTDTDGDTVDFPGMFYDFYEGDGFRSIEIVVPDESELEFREYESVQGHGLFELDRERVFGSVQFEARRDKSFSGERTGRVFGVKIRAYTGRNQTGKYVDSNEFMVSYEV